jgi:hypothetical protein
MSDCLTSRPSSLVVDNHDTIIDHGIRHIKHLPAMLCTGCRFLSGLLGWSTVFGDQL